MKLIFFFLLLLFVNNNCILTKLVDQSTTSNSSSIANLMLLALGGVSTSTTENTYTATVTSSGGTIMASDGSFILEIPADALSESRQITITRDASPLGNFPEGYANRTSILKFEPKGLVFRKPAILTINYSQGEMLELGFEERSLDFYYIKDDSMLEKMKVLSIDYEKNKAMVEVEHFSFGVGLTIQILLVNNGIISNPVPVTNIANNVIGELNSFTSEGYTSVSEYFNSHANILGPLLNKLVQILGYDPVSAAFPNADFDGDGIPNNEDPFVPNTGPSLTLVSAGPSSVSVNSGAINTTQIVWKSSKSGVFTIRSGATSCTNGILLLSGSMTAGVNQTFGPLSASSMSPDTTSYRICATSSGVTGALVHSFTRDDTAPTVSVNPSSGNYGSIQNVSLTCGDVGGSGCKAIAFSTNGTNPAFSSDCAVTAGILYTSPIATPDSSTSTIRYKSCDSAGNLSALYTQVYTVDSVLPSITINSVSPSNTINQNDHPVINWTSSRDGNFSVRIGSNCDSGIQIGNGTNVSGTVVAGVPISSTIIHSTLFSEGLNTVHFCVSNLINQIGSSSILFSFDSVRPTLAVTPPAGTYIDPQTITANCSDITSGCQKIAYTSDGTDPRFETSGLISNGFLYTGSLVTPNNAATVFKFLARDFSGNISSISEYSYLIGSTEVASPTFSPSPGNYDTPQHITISSLTANSNIYFTTDGSTPSADSTRYDSPIHIWSLAGKTLKAIAIKTGMSNSSISNLNGIYSYAPLKTGVVSSINSGDDGSLQLGVQKGYQGPAVHGQFSSDYTTTDLATGLVWKTCIQGLSGVSCGSGNPLKMNWFQATGDGANGCSSLNVVNSGSGYAGMKTWRVPTRLELETLVNFGNSGNTISQTAFPSTPTDEFFWSSNTRQGSSSIANVVTYQPGNLSNGYYKDSLAYVRCVSGLSNELKVSYIDNGDGTIKDNTTGLIWQKCHRGHTSITGCTGSGTNISSSFIDALSYCRNLTLASRSWRLPNINEIKSILDITKSRYIDTVAFPNTYSENYFSSTPYIYQYAPGFFVDFGSGYISSNIPALMIPPKVRCVSGP